MRRIWSFGDPIRIWSETLGIRGCVQISKGTSREFKSLSKKNLKVIEEDFYDEFWEESAKIVIVCKITERKDENYEMKFETSGNLMISIVQEFVYKDISSGIFVRGFEVVRYLWYRS